MADKIAVIGLGQFGFAVAKKLSDKGVEVLAIDQDIDRVELIKDDVAYAVAMDSTDIKALRSQSISDMDGVLIAIGENIEGLLLTTVHLLEMRAKRIIARAMNEQQRMILEKLGVKEIVSPEDEAAAIISEMIANPNMKSFLPLPDKHEIAGIKAPPKVFKKTVEEIDFEDSYGLQLICIKRLYEEFVEGQRYMTEHLIAKPRRDLAIESQDTLVVMGKSKAVSKFLEVNK